MLKYIFLFATLLYTFPSNAELLIGKVVGISDGDTITVLDEGNTQHKIRLSGIDAPEKNQPFGDKNWYMTSLYKLIGLKKTVMAV